MLQNKETTVQSYRKMLSKSTKKSSGIKGAMDGGDGNG